MGKYSYDFVVRVVEDSPFIGTLKPDGTVALPAKDPDGYKDRRMSRREAVDFVFDSGNEIEYNREGLILGFKEGVPSGLRSCQQVLHHFFHGLGWLQFRGFTIPRDGKIGGLKVPGPGADAELIRPPDGGWPYYVLPTGVPVYARTPEYWDDLDDIVLLPRNWWTQVKKSDRWKKMVAEGLDYPAPNSLGKGGVTLEDLRALESRLVQAIKGGRPVFYEDRIQDDQRR